MEFIYFMKKTNAQESENEIQIYENLLQFCQQSNLEEKVTDKN